MNKIIITDEYIDFSQFEGINKTITICFFPRKLVIMNKHYKNTIVEHPVVLDEDYRLYDRNIIDVFEEREIVSGTEFVKIYDTFYQE